MIASLDVDAQKGFSPLCPDELPVPGAAEIVSELNAQAALAQYRIGSKDAHSPKAIWAVETIDKAFQPLEHKNADLTWPVHCVPGTQGFELLDGLPSPSEYDYFIWKGVETDLHPYGACFHDIEEKLSTGLIEFFNAKGITQVIVGGLATDFCVKTTVLQLANAGLDVIINLGACRGIAPEGVTEALKEMQAAGVTLASNHKEIIQLLNK